mmetsp:Transcript_3233/g.4880  ORF Transcript_3233/g.4880 Transcript_3233/m.4880 type:complete len:261 (-) Transcript_3233:1355-2137(-)
MGFLVKLTLDFHHHLHGSKTDRLHGHGGKGKRDHATNDEERKRNGMKHIDPIGENPVPRRMTNTTDEGSKESERYEAGRSNGKSFSNGGSCVTSGIKSISFLTDSRIELSHLSNTSCIITNRPVYINGKTSCQVGKESNSGKRNTIKISQNKGPVDNNGKDKNRDDSTLVSQSNTVNHVSCSSSLARVRQLAHGSIRMGGVVFSDESNDKSSNGTSTYTERGHVWLEDEHFCSNSSEQFEVLREIHGGCNEDDNNIDNGG